MILDAYFSLEYRISTLLNHLLKCKFTTSRPFFHTARPIEQSIDRLALSAHYYATYTSSNIHITHTHKFWLVDSWCAAPLSSWTHQKWREYWHSRTYGLIRLGFGQRRGKEILDTIMNMQCLNARWKLNPLLAWLPFTGRASCFGSKILAVSSVAL